MKYLPTLMLICLLLQPKVGNTQSLIQNGSFEMGTTDWDYWNNSEMGFLSHFSITDQDAAIGNHAAKIEVIDVGEAYWTFKFFNVRLKQEGFGVNENDVLKISFWAKADNVERPILRTGIASKKEEVEDCNDIASCFWKLNMADHELINFDISDEWKKYEAEIPIYQTTDDVQLVFRVGEKTGTYFIDDIQLEVAGKLSFSSDWYAKSQARIDTLRKGDLSLNLVDASGQPINNAAVKIQHLRHNFEWGTAVASANSANFNSAAKQWERAVILDLFGAIVNEDDFKWHRLEPSRGTLRYDNVNLFVNWANENGLQMRGHTLFWPRRSIRLQPGWVNNLNLEDKHQAIENRIRRDLLYYRGRIKEYDVVNEPFHNPYLEDLYTDTIYTWIYNLARETDPNAKLYVNEWGNIDLWEHVRYKKFVERLLEMDTPLDGLGLQAHLNKPANWKQIKYKLDYLAEIGLPLKITEFDQNVGVNGHSQHQQAIDYGIAMRTVFSHPAVEGFYLWTLITGYSSTVESIYNPGRFKREAADTMRHLLKEVWTTQLADQTDQNGVIQFNGYYGDYQVEIQHGDSLQVYTLNFSKSDKTQTINFSLGPVTSTTANIEDQYQPNLFPNPSHDFLTIDNYPTNYSNYYIFNLQGNLILFGNLNQQRTEVDIKNLHSGAYIFQLSGLEQPAIHLRFFKTQ